MRYFLKEWNRLKDGLCDKYILFFFDYDGTLTPIVNNPDRALISKETRGLLDRLSRSQRCKLAIISGRSLRDIRRRVGLKNIIYAGNHGLELEGPKIRFKAPIPPSYKIVLKQIKDNLNSKFSGIKGAFVEDKGLSLSLHYRLVDKKNIPLLKTVFHKAIALYLMRNKIQIKTGKMVLEVRSPLKWDKGKIVLWLLARQHFVTEKLKVYPVYIGDDLTDEDAFGVLKNKGLTIFVGRPIQSQAKYYLKNSREVAKFLKQVLELQLPQKCQN